jgi:dipeptidyl aminopeptidase/acylaminoacyl peptidase
MNLFSRLNSRQLWSLGLIILALWGLVLAPKALAQEDNSPTLTVVAAALNVRSGPGVIYDAIDVLLQGEQVAIIGHDPASGWWQVQLPGGASGWVSGGPVYVSVNQAATDAAATPAGQALAEPVSTAPAVAKETIVFQTASGGPIYAINVDGTNLRYLTTGLDPALSPDGQQVAFARWEASQDGALGNLWLINVDGTGERVIHENVLNPRTPAWSADGARLAISMQHGGQPQPERTCGDQRPDRAKKAYDLTIERDDDGRISKFCYTVFPDPHWALRLVNPATGEHEDLPGDTYSLSPAWDPNNGQHVVYDGDFGLVHLDLSQGRTWPLTGDLNDHSPVFSPDGSKIALSYRQDDHWEVHLMNADGSNQRPLFPAELLAGIPLQYNGVDEQMLSWGKAP